MGFQKLSISEDGRRIVQADGSVFFYLADTGWGLFHCLDREDARMYLSNRAQKGFTAIQAVALHEFDGIEKPNAHGRLPFLRNNGAWDVAMPDLGGEYSYWAHVDYIVDQAAELGLYIALLPTWGDKFNQAWGIGPEVFEPDNAYTYGHFLGARYKDRPNIIWVTGGDRMLDTRRHFEIVCEMARGLREGDGGAHLITFHPNGGQSSAKPLHNEPWLDFNMIQSGHTRSRFNYEMIAHDYALVPPKPVVDAEPSYEHHPESFKAANGYMDEVDVRQSAYWALLSGACGHTYGDHSIWGMWTPGISQYGFAPEHFCVDWRQALDAPGAFQMAHLKTLALIRPFLHAQPAPELIERQLSGMLYIPVLRGDGFVYAYTAQGTPIALLPGSAQGEKLNAWWFDPRTGGIVAIGELENRGPLRFTPPTGGRGQDWVLVLDDAARAYPMP